MIILLSKQRHLTIKKIDVVTFLTRFEKRLLSHKFHKKKKLIHKY